MTRVNGWNSRAFHILAILVLPVLLVVALILILASGVHAAVAINVTTPLDTIAQDGACSLREAIIVANTNTPLFGPPLPAGECPHDGSLAMDTVILSAPGPYLLTIAGPGEGNATTGDLDILDDLTLLGNGQIIDGNGLDRVFDVLSATTVISGTTIRNGYVRDEFGGGIRSGGGSLALVNSAVLSNTAATNVGGLGGILGGGLYNSGVLTVSNSSFRLNVLVDLVGTSTPGDLYAGGGLYNDGGRVTIENGSVFNTNLVPHYPTAWLGNATMFRGGAIYNAGGTVVITSSSYITFNYVLERAGISGGACDLAGGGIYNDADGTVTIFVSTLEQNGVVDVTGGTSCDFMGGGIYNAGRTTVSGSQIAGNQTSDNGLGYSAGGGLYNASSGVMTVTQLTSLGRNRADWEGGGIHNAPGGRVTLVDIAASGNEARQFGGGIYNAGTMALTNSTVVDNRTNAGGGGIENRGTLTIGGNSMAISDNQTGGLGGGLRNAGGFLDVSQSRLSGNEARAGGGIWNNSALLLADVELLGNTAWEFGGGLYSEGISATVSFSACSVAHNTAYRGGGVYNVTGTVTLDPSLINDNRSQGSGAGLYNGGWMMLTATPVFSNASDQDGGGIYNAGMLLLGNAAVLTNTARQEGGGMHNVGTVSLTHTIVVSNSAGLGGGVSNWGLLDIKQGIVSDNVAHDFGGGLFNNRGSSADLVDSRLSANRADSDGGGIANNGVLSLAGVMLYENVADADVDDNGRGGGLFSEGPGSVVTLTNCSLFSNTAHSGGGAFNNLGSIMMVAPGVVSRNLASGNGGGLANDNGRLTLVNTIVATNTALHDGGGMVNDNGGDVTVVGTALLNNEARGLVGGGGIFNFGHVTLVNSTVAHNWSNDTDAGGVWNGTTLALTNTTISTNTANARGGGIFNNFGAVMTLTHVTVAFNEAVLGTGGGLYMKENTTSTLRNSIVANSIGEDCAGLGSPASAGYNLDSDGTCSLTATGDITNTDPLLGRLQDNGGGTDTHALRSGSPAIDAVPLADCPVSTDQRGVARPQGAACDIGAFEVQLRIYLPLILRNG